jgi:hypothetical protein
MGRSSAFVIVPTDNDLQRALQVVKAHNEHDGPDAGEALVRLVVVDVPRIKVSRSKRFGTAATLRILVFGSGGGMWSGDGTQPWFARAGFKMYSYNDKFEWGSKLRQQIEKEMRDIDDIDLELALLNSVLT